MLLPSVVYVTLAQQHIHLIQTLAYFDRTFKELAHKRCFINERLITLKETWQVQHWSCVMDDIGRVEMSLGPISCYSRTIRILLSQHELNI